MLMFVLWARYLISKFHQGVPLDFQSWFTTLASIWCPVNLFDKLKKMKSPPAIHTFITMIVLNNIFIFSNITIIQTFSLIFTLAIKPSILTLTTSHIMDDQSKSTCLLALQPILEFIFLTSVMTVSKLLCDLGFILPITQPWIMICGPPFPFPKCCPSHFMCV